MNTDRLEGEAAPASTEDGAVAEGGASAALAADAGASGRAGASGTAGAAPAPDADAPTAEAPETAETAGVPETAEASEAVAAAGASAADAVTDRGADAPGWTVAVPDGGPASAGEPAGASSSGEAADQEADDRRAPAGDPAVASAGTGEDVPGTAGPGVPERPAEGGAPAAGRTDGHPAKTDESAGPAASGTSADGADGPGAEAAPGPVNEPDSAGTSAGPGAPEAPAAGGAEAPPAPGQGTAPRASGKRSPVAEALAAAVRAVESGERSADSFFSEPARPRPAARKPVVRESRPQPQAVDRAVDESVLAGVRQVLAAGGAPEQLAGPAVAALGEQAAAELREDPWLLLGVKGVRPEQADGFARALLGPACGPGDERRARALVAWLLERAALAGHTVLESAALAGELARRSVPDPDEAVQAAVAEGAVLVFQEPVREPADEDEEVPVRLLLGLDRYAMAEESLADGLGRLLGTLPAQKPDWESAAAAAPSPSAAELIRAVAASGLVVHSGGEAARAEPAAVVAAARRPRARGDEEAVTVAGLLSGR
ncbi:helix-hairpin-helix domain-containing protein, partial [Streptomyces sp. AV19]|uniref:helix-hairpin-helix domain-containing protein n=1 Tax=Streptomyces sp. AV19 TaxID=2793068 RepID=UPI0027DD53F6